MTKTLTTLMLTAAFAAAPAFAQDALIENEADEAAKQEMMDAEKAMMKDKMMDEAAPVMEEGMMEKGMVEPAPVMTDKTEVMSDTVVMDNEPLVDTAPMQGGTPIMDDSIAAQGPVEVVNMACPEGTTAQPDGTCMITGDFTPRTPVE